MSPKGGGGGGGGGGGAGASFDNSSKLSNGAMKVLNSFKDDRSILFDGTLLSSGAIGFITESTLN